MTRDDEQRWREIQAWRRVCAAFHDKATRQLLDSMNKYTPLKSMQDSARNSLSSMRGAARYADDPLKRTIAGRVAKKMALKMERILERQYPRTSVTIKFGSDVKGEKPAIGTVHLTLGYMYERNVYDVFYKQERLISDWFILKADRYRLNQRYINLYECVGFNMKSGDTKAIYVSETTLGRERAFFLTHTIQSAVRSAHDHLQHIIGEQLKGERE